MNSPAVVESPPVYAIILFWLAGIYCIPSGIWAMYTRRIHLTSVESTGGVAILVGIFSVLVGIGCIYIAIELTKPMLGVPH